MSRRLPPPGAFRTVIFVPAVMSVGMLFWVATLLRDVFAWRSRQSLARRSRIAGRALADYVETGDSNTHNYDSGLRIRRSYLLTTFVLLGAGLYILIGSVLNYRREGGYVSDIAWLLAAAVAVAVFCGFLAGVAATTWAAWPNPPVGVRGVLLTTPLTRDPDRAEDELPPWDLSAATLIVPVLALILSLLVGTSRSFIERFDRPIADWLSQADWVDSLTFLDPMGSTPVAVVLAALLGLATLRCRPLFLAFPIAVLAGMTLNVVIGALIDRPRPPGSPLLGETESFPSGHVLQSVLLAGLVPLAVALLTERRWVVTPLRIALGFGVAMGAIHRIADSRHWPTDALGGILLGASLVLAVDWVMAHHRWHDPCRSCAWSPETAGRPLVGAIPLHPDRAKLFGILAHLTAAGAATGLAVLTLTRSVPQNPDGSLLGADFQVPIQLALAGLVSVGALVAWKWDAVGAVLIAFAAAGLGVFAALEYEPALAITLTLTLLIPAVLLWLSWQHQRTWLEIAGLAVTTFSLVGATWVGANEVYDHYFGPSHPQSETVGRPEDLVEWAWSGGLAADGATVVAGGIDGSMASARFTPDDGGSPVESPPTNVSDEGIARLTVTGLQPDTEYGWAVVVDGQIDESRGRGLLHTPALGPYSFTIGAGSCARVGSNGSVFDAITAADPDLFLALGDTHYSNLASSNPADFRAAYELMLGRPAQAELFRNVPVAYVWDDHDYGPDNADGSSPSRDAARTAYRQAVPHAPLADDGTINHAFTMGRVRIVMSDNRSARSPDTMLGAEQLDWLIDEIITASQTHAVVIWGNPVPWIGEANPGGDSWSAYADERATIAQALADADVDNLVMVSGDAHMVALDDGTNSAYADAPGFPVLHAAALDRPGTVKGGPYSHGTFPGGGQFGLIDIEDDGTRVVVTLSGHTWDGEVLVEKTFTFEG
ncbi:MAG: phosphatase PAP2 family protein [Actinomycetia bacterium]|nr:phosphatase PAP2 family protein [Actinomycetes bacterium]